MVLDKISKLQKDKLPGPDGISPRILIELAHEITAPLTMLFQKSIKTAQIPKEWKTSHITPIFKKGSRSDVSNYRPINLTSDVGKLL